jgi:hypothetical protein
MSAPLLTNKPTIKILLYTDDPNGITTGQDTLDLGTMLDHLDAHAPAFAQLDVQWLSRNSRDAEYKLTAKMLMGYDEIWFFPVHQMNMERSAQLLPQGDAQSELDEAEVRDLTNWMRIDEKEGLRGGGVLMTGDHANPRPAGSNTGYNRLCPDHSERELTLGLGRALGRCVPRAGLLRKWEGKPTTIPAESFNTQDPVPGIDPDGPQLQLDENPLHLFLPRFDAKGNPSAGGLAHPLFFYKDTRWIRAFPDHLHEGAVILPKKLDLKLWPKSRFVHPKPQVVAYGIDNRNFKLLNILAAYDGDCVGLGRVVADSTWHHYLNENLRKFGPPAPEGSPGDQIGQFYGNLAIWLAPLSKRREMAFAMFWWLARHLLVLEELRLAHDNDDLWDVDKVMGIGRAGYSVLAGVASPCEIHELLLAVVPDEYREKFETMYFPERGVSLSLFPSKEVILGCVVDSYQQAAIRIQASGSKDEHLNVVEVTNHGFTRAIQGHVKKIGESALKIENAFKVELT